MLVLLGVLASTRSADAEGAATPRELFQRGVEATQRGDLPSALACFEQAYAENPKLPVLYNIAQTYLALGQPLEAANVLRERAPQHATDSDATQREQISKLLLLAESRVGKLVPQLEPADARVEIDDAIARVEAGGFVELAAGRHVVSVTRPGYQQLLTSIVVRGGAITRVPLRLLPNVPAATGARSFLRLGCRVPEAALSVDSVELPRTTGTLLLAVTPGKHTIRYDRPGYGGSDTTVQTRPDAVTDAECALHLDRLASATHFGRVEILTSEAAAQVRVDGERWSGGTLPVGLHRVEVSKPGFADWQREIRVQSARPVVVTAWLNPTPEKRRADVAKLHRSFALGSAAVGVALGALAATMAIVNHSRYASWRSEQRALSQDLADDRGGPELARREAALRARATSIQRTDDFAVGSGIAGGVLLLLAGGLYWGASHAERAP